MKIITILLSILFILSLICIYYHNKGEFFYQIDEDDEEIVFTKDMIENVQLTPEEKSQRQIDYQKVRQQSSQQYTPDYSGSTNCTSRCDCCWKNSSSSDRSEACHKKYKSGSPELNECLHSNTKYAHDACKSKFGKGFLFKTC